MGILRFAHVIISFQRKIIKLPVFTFEALRSLIRNAYFNSDTKATASTNTSIAFTKS